MKSKSSIILTLHESQKEAHGIHGRVLYAPVQAWVNEGLPIISMKSDSDISSHDSLSRDEPADSSAMYCAVYFCM